MKAASALLLALVAVSPSQASPRLLHPTRLVGLDLHRSQIDDPVAHDRLRRRSRTLDATLDNMQTLYYLNLSLGTPPQQLRLHLDTGSSDLWVNSPRSELCSEKADPCSETGAYDGNRSSSYAYVNSFFNITYVDESGATGDYVSDTIRVAGTDLKRFQFGVGYSSSSSQGVLGIGYPANEVQTLYAGLAPYKNLPARLAAEGIIASSAYSLWLNDVRSPTGSLLFGGVDAARYEGDLVSLPVQKAGDVFGEFFVTMTGLDINSEVIATDIAHAVLLDSGSSLTYLPDRLTRAIYRAVNAVYQDADGVALVPCSLRDSDGSITFRFSDPARIRVPFEQMILELKDASGKAPSLGNGVPACLFGIAPSNGKMSSVLGDTFLRSAYVVYDLDNNQISLAQSRFNVTGSDLREIGKGPQAVPSAILASSPVAAISGLPPLDDADSKAAPRLVPALSFPRLVVFALAPHFLLAKLLRS